MIKRNSRYLLTMRHWFFYSNSLSFKFRQVIFSYNVISYNVIISIPEYLFHIWNTRIYILLLGNKFSLTLAVLFFKSWRCWQTEADFSGNYVELLNLSKSYINTAWLIIISLSQQIFNKICMHDLENISKICSTKISLKLSQINLLKYIAINTCIAIAI